MQFKKNLFVCFILLLTACTQQRLAQPAAVLEEYIKIAMNAKDSGDKKKLLELTVGEAKAELERMSAKDFDEAFIKGKLNFKSFKAKDLREESSGEVSLVYELVYEDGAGATASQSTNRKIAYLQKDSAGAWKIKSTKNIKSFLEKKEAIEIQLDAPTGTVPTK